MRPYNNPTHMLVRLNRGLYCPYCGVMGIDFTKLKYYQPEKKQ